jgi:hypothetical protein
LISVPKPPSAPPKAPLRSTPQQVDFSRTTTGHLIPAGRAYKPKASSRVRQRRPRNRNMTLDNTRGSQQSVHRSSLCYRFNLITSTRRINKRMKYLDIPCPHFTTARCVVSLFITVPLLNRLKIDYNTPFVRNINLSLLTTTHVIPGFLSSALGPADTSTVFQMDGLNWL